MNTPPSVLPRIKKFFVSLGFVVATFAQPAILVGATAATVVFVAPHAAHAGVPVAETASIPQTLTDLLKAIKEGLITAGKVGVKNALRTFLEKLAYDEAVALATLGENQTPLINPKGIQESLAAAGDAALGDFFDTLASENGFISLNLCDLPTLDSIHLQLLLPKLTGVEPYTPACTWSEIQDSVSDYASSFQDQWRLIMDDPSTLFNLSVKFDDGNNALADLMKTWAIAEDKKAEAEVAENTARIKSDFNDLKQDVSGYTKTPSNVLEMQAQATISNSTAAETTLSDDPIADAVTVFTRTLSSKLMDRIGSGIIDFFTSTDISDSVSGNSSTAAAGAGVAGATEQYASFQTVSFNAGGTLDILTQFAACPEKGADTTNCILNEGFRLAIEEQLTVQQAIDQGLLAPDMQFAFDSSGAAIEDPNSGIPYRSIEILKQYNVVPVGWVLAAEYNKDFDANGLTLQTLIDAFDQCDVTNYSPYCGLVDPTWTLKAPEAYCKVEGYGETLADRSFEDLDGSDYTPDAELVSRLSTCVDTQSCLTESDTGQCEAYGYCTAQEDIYRFEGDSCPAYMASCDTFTDADGNALSYLSNTLNFNDCSIDNAGCQWYCTVYNDVDSAFQCAGQGLVYNTCSTDGGCSCTLGAETCTVADGGFECTTASAAVCTLGTQTDAVANVDSAISFDDDVTPCDSSDAGCTEFITVKGGANVLFNGSFEDFDSFHTTDTDALAALADEADSSGTSPYDDTFGFYGEDGAGAACSLSSGTQTCYGWQLVDGAKARAVSNADDGAVAAQLNDSGTGALSAVFETGQALANRSFEFTYSYKNPSSVECDGEYWISADDGTTTAPADAIAITYYATGVYDSNDSQIVTFGDSVTETAVRVGITAPAGCSLVIDSAKLEENSGDSGYTAYGDSAVLTYVNMNETITCDPADVGCQLYTPLTGETDIAVPGIITNPLSDVCGNGDDFSDPACSQCAEEFVGCDAYIAQPTPYSAPINTVAYFADPLTIDTGLAAGIAQRTGYYCEGTETACSPEREALDCGGTLQCLPSISIIPDTGTQCSAAAVGCEEYVNIDAQAAGGEGLEYYTYIRQCVKETQDQIDAGSVDTFYTFEGSDETGYQIRSWYLKQSDVDNGPCTSLDLYGNTAETSQADCVDSTAGQQTCTAADIGVNPDCTEYYDDAGAVYYRLKSATVTVSDECLGLRNSLDDRLYYSIPSESTTCAAQDNMCREYSGSEGGDVHNIVEDNFDSSVWNQGESSSTVITASTGQSMAVGAGTTNGYTNVYTDVSGSVSANKSYVVTFWAKSSEGSTVISPYFSSGSTVTPFDDGEIELSTEWKQYQAGPFLFDTVNGDEQFGFTVGNTASSGTYIVYLDNVTLSQSDSHYLIAGTSDLCHGYEGCEEYSDPVGNINYLKSFVSLCDENDVGCQAMLATNNSDTPFYTEYNGDNEYTEDDVAVAEDSVQTIVVTDDVLCDAGVASCEAVGLPTLDATENVESFAQTYVLNDPDSYDTILCQEQQRSCEEYTNQDAETVYFKNPGEKYCTYNSGDGAWQTPDGDPCPLQNSDTSAAPSQPKGPICNGGVREGELCTSDAQCPNSDGTTLSRCVSNADENSGWVGTCSEPYAGCTLYVDPNPQTLVDNAQFETDVDTNTDATVGEPDGIPDGWNQDVDINAYYARDFDQEGGLPSGGTVGCSVFASSTAHVFDRVTSMQLQAGTVADDWCMVRTDQNFIVDKNGIYSLSGNVYLEDASDRFAIGLLFYDADGDEIYYSDTAHTATLPLENLTITAHAGGSRSTDALTEDQWLHFYGDIGPNLTQTFPEDTYYVKVFIETRETGTDSSVYFDNIQFGEDDQYTYIASSVDGSGQGNDNSCGGEVDIANGCVAFRDTTSNDLTYLSTIDAETAANPSYATSSCEFGSGIASEGCETNPDAADSNVVIKVQNDRQCSEWLTCVLPRYTYDTEGNVTSTLCMQIGRCTARNPDTGACIEFTDPVSSTDLGYESDLTAVSQPGNVDDLIDIQNLAGYSSVGATWEGVCSDTTCVGGANDGATCASNADCTDAQVEYGYYSPENMTQVGSSGSSSLTDIVNQGDFEDTYCNGTGIYNSALTYTRDNGDGTTTAEDLDVELVQLETQRDKRLSCTLDAQCRTTATESKMETILDSGDLSQDPDSIPYSEGWCKNVNQSTLSWGIDSQWSQSGEANMMIIDYENGSIDGAEYTPALSSSSNAIADDQYATAYGAGALDLNNVMLVTPTDDDDSGIQVDLGTNIVQGNQYTVSFDAQYMQSPAETDYIQVGIANGNPSSSSNIDYFEQGTAMADIVFVVDASNSMAAEIGNVATATSSLITNLEAAGINYQTAIVTTGGNDAPAALDFDDYSSSGSTTHYGADDGTDRDFTDSASEFTAAMSYISSHLEGDYVHNYEALADIAAGVMQDGHTLGFRPGAIKFVVLLSDTAPEHDSYTGGADWSSDSEETDLMSTIGTPYVFYAITSGEDDTIDSDSYAESDAYDALVTHLGGALYDISSTDYSSILDTISGSMSTLVSEFKFSTDYERYTLGPITITQNDNPEVSSFLFIRQVAGSGNTPFVIDNVSLKPALEVNKENNINSDNSTWLISRDCRAYPDTDSRSCDYSDEAGTIYQGWKGYCLQHDVDLSSTSDFDESTRCVAWWPVDVISGEPDNTPRDKVLYTGKYPVYQCLVAKGNASLSVCADTTDGTDGLLCSSDSDCTGGTCMGDGDSFVPGESYYTYATNLSNPYATSYDEPYDLRLSYEIGNYVVKNNFSGPTLDVLDIQSLDGTSSADDHETAFFHKFSVENGDLPVESSVHISEIDDLHFYMGEPLFADVMSDEDKNTQAELSWLAGGAVGANDFNLRADLQSQSGNMFEHGSLFLNGTDASPSSAEGWFYQCSDDASDPDCMAIYSYQKAAWCGSAPCDADSSEEEWDNADFTFVKAVMPKTEDSTLETYIDSVLDNEADPFTAVSDLTSGSTAWSAHSNKGAAGVIQSDNGVGGHVFDQGFFQSEASTSENEEFSDNPDDDFAFSGSANSCWGVNYCGANIVGVKFDFEDGYLQNIYIFYWAGMRNLDPNAVINPYWEISLREPCLLAVQAVDSDAQTTPWMTRVTGSPSYVVPGIGLIYDMDNVDAVYGSIAIDSSNEVSSEDDYAAFDGVTPTWTPSNYERVTGSATTLPYVQLGSSNGTGLPFACVGNCAASVCAGTDGSGFAKEGEDANDYYTTYDGSSCQEGVIGVYGSCSNHPEMLCTTNSNCPDYTGDDSNPGETCDQGDWSNKGVAGSTYNTQVTDAATTAWDRYRLLFPTLGKNANGPTKLSDADLYFAASNPTVSTTGTQFAYNAGFSKTTVDSNVFSDAFDSDGDNIFDFEDMPECGSGPREDDDYCYVRPAVTNIVANNNTTGNIGPISSGSFVSLQFDSSVDDDQEPLQTIRIEWLGAPLATEFNDSGTAASDTWQAAATSGHSYAYAYTCNPADDTYWNPGEQACEYHIRIQIEDNWGFCSGEEGTSATRSIDGPCTSYDAYDGVVYVTP